MQAIKAANIKAMESPYTPRNAGISCRGVELSIASDGRSNHFVPLRVITLGFTLHEEPKEQLYRTGHKAIDILPCIEDGHSMGDISIHIPLAKNHKSF